MFSPHSTTPRPHPPASLTTPPQAAYRTPQIYAPYPCPIDPRLPVTSRRAKTWARRMGMLETPAPGLPARVWDEDKVDAMDYARFGGMSHPEASDDQLDLASQWHLWGYYVPDYFDTLYRSTGDLIGARQFASQLSSFAPEDGDGPTPPPGNPVERGLSDLWRRTAPAMPGWLRARFRDDVLEYADRYVQELANIVQAAVPDLSEYIALRAATFGYKWTEDLLCHWAAGPSLPPRGIFRTWQLREVSDIFAEIIGLQSDVQTYQHEAGTIAVVNNGVHVMNNLLACGPQQAADALNHLATRRLLRLEDLAGQEIPAMLDHQQATPAQHEAVTALLRWMRHFLGASHEWFRRRQLDGGGLRLPARPAATAGEGDRTQAMPPPYRYPTGVGTSAAALPLRPTLVNEAGTTFLLNP